MLSFRVALVIAVFFLFFAWPLARRDSVNKKDKKGVIHQPSFQAHWRNPQSIPELHAYIQRLDPSSSWQILRNHQGGLTSIFGGKIEAGIHDNRTALTFARAISPFFGLPPNQLHSEVLSEPLTEGTKIYRIFQAVNDDAFYNSYLALYVHNSNGTVYSILNELKTVRSVFNETKLTAAEVPKLLDSESPQVDSHTWLFVDPSGSAVKAYLAKSADSSGNRNGSRREVLVSAVNGKILSVEFRREPSSLDHKPLDTE
ncbi:MAG: hypothetical protein COT74_03450 [Bdellovibrionales bacterium CG10_big_fil_rev_8_21_14_0_10_45_34]|nr:MAG: hypothetical protein COT74_03450 [Bdellovibrionales bacterium CG10_big_fil_rev_8_21_14_0_10_45_34]